MLTLLSLLLACGGAEEAPTTSPDPDDAPLQATPPSAAPAPPSGDAKDRPDALTADQCGSIEGGSPPDGPGCLSGTITCGQTVVGHTLGGGNHFTTQFYEKKQCTPATTDHDGGDERVYKLEIPEGDHRVTVHLDTPCADLDLASMRWSGDDCPTLEDALQTCDMWPKPGTESEKVTMVSRKASTWLLVVEGKGDAEGAFSLTVDCADGLY